VVWTLWKEWPHRRFKILGEVVSQERHPVSYWIVLGFGSLLAIPFSLQGLRMLVFALTH